MEQMLNILGYPYHILFFFLMEIPNDFYCAVEANLSLDSPHTLHPIRFFFFLFFIY